MKTLLTALRRAGRDDSGFGVVEVVVAMVIFALISTGTAYAMMSVLQVTRDSRARHVATNLAAQEIDLARDVDDLLELHPTTHDTVLGGDTYTVALAATWWSDTGTDISCGTSGGALRFKRVTVTVSWQGMRDPTKPVRSDTVIDPDGRINDPDLGTLLVSVLRADGTGASGVTITATPAASAPGGAATVTPAVTDSDGCAYLLKVSPGNYDVSANRSGYVDIDQNSTAKATGIAVTKGVSTSVSFAYDAVTSITGNYASNEPSGTVYFPLAIDTTYASPYAAITKAASVSTATNSVRKRTIQLFPMGGGYQLFTGRFARPAVPLPKNATAEQLGCLSPDPAEWKESDTLNAGARQGVVGSGDTDVPMGIATIAFTADTSRGYLKAVSAVAASSTGDPGCAFAMTYTFGKVLEKNKTTTIALPYGTWKLTNGTSSSMTTDIASSGTVKVTSRGSVSGSTVTFDPRKAK